MKKITAALLGAGQRGTLAYASYALMYPSELKFVAVAEPREDRLQEFKKLHNIEEKNCFSSWKELLSKPKLADCILICTQDKMHYEPIMEAAKKGYHILCEKPVVVEKQELIEINNLAQNYDKILSVCHVLRYSPFFVKIKNLLENKVIGELVNIQHIESIGNWHMAHSFVRGNWRNKEESSPIILAKCCHDMDILLWLVNSKCVRLSSFGGLKHFKKENALEGAPKYCMDGCKKRSECPFYAPKFYLEHPSAINSGFTSVVSLDESADGILKALKDGPYGRCVYHCDNDVADHQVVNMEYENGITASFTMSAFTDKCERIINLMGTRGQIKGNMEENRIEILDFSSGNKTVIELNVPSGGHSGSDVSMMKHFIELVQSDGTLKDVSSATEAIESHLIALAAEESRINGGTLIYMNDFCKQDE